MASDIACGHVRTLAYGGWGRSTSGSQNFAVLQKRHENAFYSAATKSKDNA